MYFEGIAIFSLFLFLSLVYLHVFRISSWQMGGKNHPDYKESFGSIQVDNFISWAVCH